MLSVRRALGRPAETQKRTIRSHMDGESVQVQQVAADAVDTKEWGTIAKWLKRDDRVHRGILRSAFRESLRQPSYGKTAGQYIDGEMLTEPCLDGGEQAHHRKRITTEIEKV